MKKSLIALTLIAALGSTACSNLSTTQQGTLIGALGGAAAGAVIGKATGSDHVGRDAAIGAAVGGIGGYIWSSHMEKQRQAMEAATEGTGIEVSRTPDNELKLEVPADFSFDVGQAAIKPSMRPVLDRLAQTLNQNTTTQVRIIGHTDSTGSDAVNQPLSVNRAVATRQYLSGRGVASARMNVDGKGASQPVASNSSAAGRAQNRRVEIYVAQPAK